MQCHATFFHKEAGTLDRFWPSVATLFETLKCGHLNSSGGVLFGAARRAFLLGAHHECLHWCHLCALVFLSARKDKACHVFFSRILVSVWKKEIWYRLHRISGHFATQDFEFGAFLKGLFRYLAQGKPPRTGVVKGGGFRNPGSKWPENNWCFFTPRKVGTDFTP